jgi:hypothetical protein
VLSATFLSEVMLDLVTNLVIESGTLGSVLAANVSSQVTGCNLKPRDTPLRPYATAMYIEGLAVLATVDAGNASTWNGLCVCDRRRMRRRLMAHRMANAVTAATDNTAWFGYPPLALPGVLNFSFGTGSQATSHTLDDQTYNGPSLRARCGRTLTASQAGSCRACTRRTIARPMPACASISARSSARRCVRPRATPRHTR